MATAGTGHTTAFADPFVRQFDHRHTIDGRTDDAVEPVEGG